MRLLLDMNLSPQTVAGLQRANWDVVRASDVLAHDTPDVVILEWAREHGRVIITHDNDFAGLLAASGASQPSVLTLRVSHTAPAEVTALLLRVLPLLAETLAAGAVAVATDRGLRWRPLPIT